MEVTGYRLKHPNSKRHYVGITTKPCDDRLKRHLKDKAVNKRTNWVKSHESEKNMFYMETIFKIDDLAKAKELEKYWIAEDRKNHGFENIMNGTGGGGGDGAWGRIASDETKQKMKENHVGSRGMKHTQEAKRKIAEGNRIKPISDEFRQKISLLKRGNKNMLGKKHSHETIQKMSLSQIGNKNKLGFRVSQETKDKISASKIGIPVSPQHRNKIAETKRKLKAEQIIRMFDLLNSGMKQKEIAKIFNVDQSTISYTKKVILLQKAKEVNCGVV